MLSDWTRVELGDVGVWAVPRTPAGRVAAAEALLRPLSHYEMDENGDAVPVYGEPLIDAAGYMAIVSGASVYSPTVALDLGPPDAQEAEIARFNAAVAAKDATAHRRTAPRGTWC
jgi:hypothetical protein